MDKVSKNVIRVKNRYANHLKHLAKVDKLLSTLKLHKLEELEDDDVCFWVKFNDDNLSRSISELQVSCVVW